MVVAFGLPVFFLPNLIDQFILPRASLVIAGACLGAGLALLTPDRPSLGRLRWPLVAAAAAAALAFGFSVSPATSFAGSYLRYESLPLRLAYLVLAALPVWLLRDDRSRDRLVAAFVLGTSIASLEALQQLVTSVPFRPDGNVGNAGILAALIAMAVPLAISRALRGGLFVFAWWLGVVALGAGLYASTSRAGGLGVLAGCLALVVFRRLETAEDLDMVVRAFELQLLGLTGYRPQLHRCLECSEQIQPGPNAFSARLGGVLCPACSESDRSAPPISVPALKVMRNLQTNEDSMLRVAHLEAEVHSEVERCLQEYIVYHLEARPRSMGVLERLRRELQPQAAST